MHGVQIGNSLVGYGAGAWLREGSGLPWGARDTGGVPQTARRKRRRREEKTFHSGSREESRVRWNRAKSASQGDLPKGTVREGGQSHSRPEGLLRVWPRAAHPSASCQTACRKRRRCLCFTDGETEANRGELMCPGSPSPGTLFSRTSHLPEKAEQKEEWFPRLPILKSPCLCPASS